MSLQAQVQIRGDSWEPDSTPENLLCPSWWESHTWLSWATFTDLWKKKKTSPVQVDLDACSWGDCLGFNVNFETGVEVCCTWSLGYWLLFQILFSKKTQELAHRIWLCFCWNNSRRQRLPWRTAHRKTTTNNTLQSTWEPLAAWRKVLLSLTKEKWVFSSGLSVSAYTDFRQITS